MVGNAVPPDLSYYLAKKIIEDLSSIHSNNYNVPVKIKQLNQLYDYK